MKINQKNGYQRLDLSSSSMPHKKTSPSRRLFKMFVVTPFKRVRHFFTKKNDVASTPPIVRDRLRKLGQGGGGSVHEVEYQGQNVAQKRTFESVKEREEIGLSENERTLLAEIDHPHIIKGFLGKKENTIISVREQELDVNLESTSEEDADYILVNGVDALEGGSLMEMANCGLDKVIDKLPGNRKRHALHLLSAVSYLHDKHICHMDLKPHNVLWSNKNGVMLCDFDAAVKVNTTGNLSEKTEYISFTPQYVPPELLRQIETKQRYCLLSGPACDSWSLGCTLAELITGERVFSHSDVFRKNNTMKYWNEIPFKPRVETYLNAHKNTLGPEVYEILKGMLDINPDTRLSVSDALKKFPVVP